MKKLLFLLLPVSISCTRTTGDKLKGHIESRWKSHSNFEHFKIDSFRYELSDLREYYDFLINNEKELRNSEAEMLVSLKSMNESSPSTNISAYSQIVSIIHDISISNDKIKFINRLYDSKPDSQQVYNVDYYIDYQTDKFNHKGHETDYLYAKDLKPVYINIDSLYSLNSKTDFDSVAYVNALKLNDSLEASMKSLQREMELKIASGIPPLTELNYRYRISKINQAKAENQLKYPFLF